MTSFFEDTLDRHEIALEKAKQSVDSGLSIAFDVMQKIQFKTPMLAERLIPSGQGKVLLKIDKIKQEVNVAIEAKRASKEIGSSLEAKIKIKVKKDKFELLEGLNLAEYFITSKAEKIASENEEIEVDKAEGVKCERCWKILDKKCSRKSCPIE